MLKAANKELPPDCQIKTLVFSNYPILLDKKKGVYSNYISFSNLTTDPRYAFRLPKGAYIIIDEAQKYYSNREFKNFPKKTMTMLTHHRHSSIERIVFMSQDPSRVDMTLRLLAESFTKIDRSKFYKWLGIVSMKTTTYYRADDYGKPCPKKPMFGLGNGSAQPLIGGYFDYDKKNYMFFTKPVFKAYDTKYFRFVFDRLPLLPFKSFTSKTLTEDDLVYLGIDDDLT